MFCFVDITIVDALAMADKKNSCFKKIHPVIQKCI